MIRKFCFLFLFVFPSLFLTSALAQKQTQKQGPARVPELKDPTSPPEVSSTAGQSLPQLIEKGLEYSPVIQKSEAEYKKSKAEFSQIEARLFPTITAVGQTVNRQIAPGVFGTAGAIRQNQYIAELQGSQPLYQGGAVSAGLASGNLSKKIAQQNVFMARQDYLFSLISAYFDLSETFQRLEQAKINRDFLREYTKIARQYASIGRTKSIDRLQADANLASSESIVLEQESQVENQRNRLIQLLGWYDQENSSLEIQVGSKIQPIDKMELKQALDQALKNNPKIRVAELQVEKQKADNSLTLVEDKPRLSIDGSYGYTSPNREEWFEEDFKSYSIGLTLRVPIFSGLSSLGKRRANAESYFQKEKDLDLVRDDLRRSLSSALETLSRDFERVKALKSAVDLGRRAMDSALRDYRRGLVSSTDVVQIQGSRYAAEQSLLNVEYSYLKQVLSLRRDLGVDLKQAYANF